MGTYFLIVNPAKRQYFDPARFGEAVKLSGLLRGPHCVNALKLLVADCFERSPSSLRGAWVGDPVVFAGDHDRSDSTQSLHALAVSSFANISYALLAELCLDEETAVELVTKAKTDNSLVIDLGATLEQYDPAPLRQAWERILGRPWRKEYTRALKASPHWQPLARLEPSTGAPAAMSLIVLRCSDIAETKRFYEAIGFAFQAEKHGAGAEHWSTPIGDTVLELYPSQPGAPKIGRLGFRVANVREAVSRLSGMGARTDKVFDDSTRTAVVVDPDGIKLELSEDARAPSTADTWAVWRQDDNGNRFLIQGGLTREEADRACAEFEAKGHKQVYWVSREERGRDGL